MTEKERIKATLFVASTGGHLDELFRLRSRLVPDVERETWVTFDDAQSRSLLYGKQAHYVHYIPPRGYVATAAALPTAVRTLQNDAFSRVVSTGAAIALPFLTAGRLQGLSCHYIESAARSEGPSLTGTIASRIPGVHVYSQYPSWASKRWQYRGSLFDAYRGSASTGVRSISRVVVTLGTMRTYAFRRAAESLSRILPSLLEPNAEVLWQVGCTDVEAFGIAGRDRVPLDELRRALASADLVIAHAGVGSALSALDAGKCPVLLPRSSLHAEHVDDHQQLIAHELGRRGLAVVADPDALSAQDLLASTRTVVTRQDWITPFQLSR
jgi:UDP-N-acetylglucosamine--N-acetylmuramyl-(pentapeptide) pyrophosphoryl-undecaprenol N-acetylglucosamine transferase